MSISILGLNIKKLRELKGFSGYKLSKEAGIGTSTISEIETGKRQSLNSSTIEKIAAVLEVSPNKLLSPIEDQEYIVEDIFETIDLILSSEEITLDNKEITKSEKELLKYMIDEKLYELMMIRELFYINKVDITKLNTAKEILDLKTSILNNQYRKE